MFSVAMALVDRGWLKGIKPLRGTRWYRGIHLRKVLVSELFFASVPNLGKSCERVYCSLIEVLYVPGYNPSKWVIQEPISEKYDQFLWDKMCVYI